VKLVHDPTLEELRAALLEFRPTLLYVAGRCSYDRSPVTGLVGPVQFRGEQVYLLAWMWEWLHADVDASGIGWF
jgi:hypothetical protein